MARNDPHFRLRLPEALKRRVEAAAAKEKRSINAEIVFLLEFALDFFEKSEEYDSLNGIPVDELEAQYSMKSYEGARFGKLASIQGSLQSMMQQLQALQVEVSRISISDDGHIELEMPVTDMDLVPLDQDEKKS